MEFYLVGVFVSYLVIFYEEGRECLEKVELPTWLEVDLNTQLK